MSLSTGIEDYIEKREALKGDIFIDRSDELSEDEIRAIFSAENREVLDEILYGIEQKIISNSDEESCNIANAFRKEVLAAFSIDEDEADEDFLDKLKERIDEMPIDFDIDMGTLYSNSGDVHLTIAYGRKENPKYWPEDFYELPAIWRDSLSDAEHHLQNLSDICALLGIDNKEMSAALMKKFDRLEPIELPHPTIPIGIAQTDAAGFINDWENSTSDYAVLTFMTRISIQDFINNFDRFREDGVVIPSGGYAGLHDPLNGSCSLMEIELKHPLVLPFDRLSISAGDKEHEYGYSLDQICGLTSQAWGLEGTSLGVIRTAEESALIHVLQDLSKSLFLGGHLFDVARHSADILARELKDGEIDGRTGLSSSDVAALIAVNSMRNYKFKDMIHESDRETTAASIGDVISQYVAGVINKEGVVSAMLLLSSEPKEEQASVKP